MFLWTDFCQNLKICLDEGSPSFPQLLPLHPDGPYYCGEEVTTNGIVIIVFPFHQEIIVWFWIQLLAISEMKCDNV